MRFRLLLLVILFSTSTLMAISPPIKRLRTLGLPWFTGPLLTPSGHTVEDGHYNIEPYIFYNVTHGKYTSSGKYQSTVDKRFWNLILPIQLGVAPNTEFDIIPQLFSNHKDGQSFTSIGDTELRIAYQVNERHTGLEFFPSANVYITETVPTGKYKKFSYDERDVQGTGSGTFLTSFGVVFTRTYHFGGEHFLALRSNLSYSVASKVRVKGFNAHGGGFRTDGYVYPGDQFLWQLGLEYSLNKNWGLANDFQYINTSRTKFTGQNGVLADGTEASNTSPSSYQWSVAPAIEYSFNMHIGLIAGVWFTFYGRNEDAFISGILALNVYY